MYEQTNTMMETKALFQIPQLLDGDDFTSEDLADDMEGLRLSFTRIKIPGGGHLQFEIPSGNPDVPDYAPYLEGVILYSHNSNAYWPEGSEYDDDQPPLCQSFDGKVGYGEPGGTCADCVLNQFGSDGNNKGKACKNMRMLYLLRSGEYMPIQIALPPTSLTPYTRFVNEAFLSRRRKVCTGVVRIGLKKAVSGSHEYCVATFTKIADFAGEDLAHIRAYADGFVAQIKNICQRNGVEEPNIFTEFGSFTVGESGAVLYSIVNQKQQNDRENWYMIDSSFITTLPDTWGINQRYIMLAVNNWDKEYQRVLLGGLTCDSEDFYNSECHTSAIFLPKLEAGNTQYIGFFHTGAYQESLGGFGGIQHCLIPAPKHVIIDRDKSDNEYYTRLFAKEQSYRSMLRILGY